MKKSPAIIAIILLIISSIFSTSITAELLNPDLSVIPDTPKSAAEQGRDYLSKSLLEPISNSTFAKAITSFYEKNNNWIVPLFKDTVGISPSLSWIFLLAIVTWLSLIIWANRIFGFFNITIKYSSIIFTIIFAIIISIFKIASLISNFIVKKIESFEDPLNQVIAVLAVIIILIFLSALSLHLRKTAIRQGEIEGKKKMKTKIKETKEETEETKERLERIEEALSGEEDE